MQQKCLHPTLGHGVDWWEINLKEHSYKARHVQGNSRHVRVDVLTPILVCFKLWYLELTSNIPGSRIIIACSNLYIQECSDGFLRIDT